MDTDLMDTVGSFCQVAYVILVIGLVTAIRKSLICSFQTEMHSKQKLLIAVVVDSY